MEDFYSEKDRYQQRIYRALAILCGSGSTVALISGINVVARVSPTFIPGILIVQTLGLISGIGLAVLTENTISRFAGLMLTGGIIFGLIGGWWDFFYLLVKNFNVNGINMGHIVVTALIGAAIRYLLKLIVKLSEADNA